MSSALPPPAVSPPPALAQLKLRLWTAPAPRCCSSSPLPFQLMLMITQDPDRASDPDPYLDSAPGSPLPPFPSNPTIFIMVQSDK